VGVNRTGSSSVSSFISMLASIALPPPFSLWPPAIPDLTGLPVETRSARRCGRSYLESVIRDRELELFSIKRTFGGIKDFSRIATWHHKLPQESLGAVYLAATIC
jgi:hypothetical protein